MLSTSISGYAPIGQIISRRRDREEVFLPLRKGKYPLAESGKHSPYSPAPQVPQEATYIGSEISAISSTKQQAISQHHRYCLYRSKKRPLLVSKRTSTTHPIVPVLLTRVTSTGQLADQYWSHLPLNRSEAPSSNSRLSHPYIYDTPRAGSDDHSTGRIS